MDKGMHTLNERKDGTQWASDIALIRRDMTWWNTRRNWGVSVSTVQMSLSSNGR